MSLIGRVDSDPAAAAAPPVNPLALLPKLPAIDNTYGAMLIGTFLSLILYGFALLQAYNYTRLRFKDPTLVKVYVAVIMVMDTFQTILSMHISYWYLVTNYFDPTRLFSGIWSLNLLGVSVGMTLVACQSFFARRVYIIGDMKYRILVILTGFMFVGELGFAIAGTYYASVLPNFAEFRKVSWLNSASFSLAIAADLILTVVLIKVLRKSRTGFDHTDSLIDVLIMYSVCTGLITTVFSAVSLIVAVALPNTLIYAGCDFVVSKLYVNSVLAALNYRDSVRNPTTSLRQAKAINLSTSVRTGTHGGASMEWTTANHIRSTEFQNNEFQNSIIELKSTREMIGEEA